MTAGGQLQSGETLVRSQCRALSIRAVVSHLGPANSPYRRHPQRPLDDEETISAHHTALALHLLHSKLAAIGSMFVLPSFDARLREAVTALDSPGLPVDLSSGDRRLLRTASVEGMARLGSSHSGTRVLHGSPHRMSILSANGIPVFIDVETVEAGPVEWDLAHLDREVADRYPEEINQVALEICGRTISAATSTWCWESLERGPDMRFHAEQHLEAVRSAMS